jgi:hypothetical protein
MSLPIAILLLSTITTLLALSLTKLDKEYN